MGEPRLSSEVARRVVALCQAQGVRGRELARRTGIAPVTMSQRLNGRFPFTLDELPAVASALDVSVRLLIDGRNHG